VTITAATTPAVCDAHAAQQWSTCDCSATVKTLPTWTPPQVDTALAAIYAQAAAPAAQAASLRARAYDLRHPRNGRPASDTNHAIAAQCDIEADAADVAQAVILEQARPYNTEYYRRGGWTRAFIVDAGHVHSSTSCSTCYPTTQFGWLPEVSGSTEAESVARAADGACTVCYPTAPVAAKGTRTLYTAAELDRAARRAERETAAAAKAAKKAANALGIKVDYVETIPAAKSYLTDVVAYGYTHMKANADLIAPALAERLGVTVEQVWADAAKRAARRA
jgi:hypothetical protein